MRRRLLLALAVALVGGVPASGPAFAEDPATDAEIPLIEHRRDPPSAIALRWADRRHAAGERGTEPPPDLLGLRAVGRIGSDRDGTEALLRTALAERPVADAAIWAAGISGDAPLAHDLVALLDAVPAQRQATLEALGFLGDARVDGYLIPLLGSDDAATQVAGCLALSRLPSDRGLDDVLALVDAKQADVARAACVAAWRMVGARRKRLSTKDAPWDGDLALVSRLWSAAGSPDAETRIFARRAIATALPTQIGWRWTYASIPLPVAGPDAPTETETVRESSRHLVERLFDRVGAGRANDELVSWAADPDARVAADFLARIAAAPDGKPLHEGKTLVRILEAAARHPEPLVRETLGDVVRQRRRPIAGEVLAKALETEKDPRVRDAYAVALAACGDAKGAEIARVGPGAAGAREDRSLVTARILVESRDPKRLAETLPLVRGGGSGATAWTVRALEALLEGLSDVDDPVVPRYGRALLTHADPIVRTDAASLLGEKGDATDVERLRTAYDDAKGRGGNDVRGEVVGALGKIAKRVASDAKAASARDAAIARVRDALKDPAPTVRLAAREAAGELDALKDLPEARAELGDRNDWKGLPRPKAPVLGLDLTRGGAWLSETEILALAKAITAQDAGVVLTVEGLGEIRLELDAEQCPVHAANIVLLAAAGTYDGTTWHRVVPAFVIQGGDPRGDGSGDAGYSVPDEISTHSFTRGALGMPKNTKDTGGCQIFLMHCWAPHLDGKYTCFGRAISGLGVIDRVRVGDVIASARVVARIHPTPTPTPTPTK